MYAWRESYFRFFLFYVECFDIPYSKYVGLLAEYQNEKRFFVICTETSELQPPDE